MQRHQEYCVRWSPRYRIFFRATQVEVTYLGLRQLSKIGEEIGLDQDTPKGPYGDVQKPHQPYAAIVGEADQEHGGTVGRPERSRGDDARRNGKVPEGHRDDVHDDGGAGLGSSGGL